MTTAEQRLGLCVAAGGGLWLVVFLTYRFALHLVPRWLLPFEMAALGLFGQFVQAFEGIRGGVVFGLILSTIPFLAGGLVLFLVVEHTLRPLLRRFRS